MHDGSLPLAAFKPIVPFCQAELMWLDLFE
jgi:hypothetical protein